MNKRKKSILKKITKSTPKIIAKKYFRKNRGNSIPKKIAEIRKPEKIAKNYSQNNSESILEKIVEKAILRK